MTNDPYQAPTSSSISPRPRQKLAGPAVFGLSIAFVLFVGMGVVAFLSFRTAAPVVVSNPESAKTVTSADSTAEASGSTANGTGDSAQ